MARPWLASIRAGEPFRSRNAFQVAPPLVGEGLHVEVRIVRPHGIGEGLCPRDPLAQRLDPLAIAVAAVPGS